jgi:hypothetical protein
MSGPGKENQLYHVQDPRNLRWHPKTSQYVTYTYLTQTTCLGLETRNEGSKHITQGIPGPFDGPLSQDCRNGLAEDDLGLAQKSGSLVLSLIYNLKTSPKSACCREGNGLQVEHSPVFL